MTIRTPFALGLALLSTLNPQLSTCFAQGTAFTYQGWLNDGSSPANGSYDLTCMAFNASTGGTANGTLTNTGVAVSNGLFTTTLDFHRVPDGSLIWFEFGVRTNGGGSFTTVSPRQAVTPSPYALFANTASNLVGSLPASQLSGTVTAAQLPSSVVTNGGTGVALNGTFSGNGAGLTDVSGTLPWQVVTGTSVQAVPNIGYLLTNNALVTITLPVAPSPGTIVRVSGSGTNGWKIAQNAGQSVRTGNFSDYTGLVWVPRIYGNYVASSADGAKLIAVVKGGQIDTSTDSGVTWTLQAGSPSASWSSVASSSDGSKLVAGIQFGQIYTSTNSGTNWTARAISTNWTSVASSADGTKQVAGSYGGQIYTSTDSGVNWVAQNSGSRYWASVAASADGTKLVAVEYNGPIYTSTDSGTNWTARASGSQSWNAIASSADGTKLVAVALGSQIYTSANSGLTWLAQNSGSLNWYSVASSADGSKLVAGTSGQIYISPDSGMTWTAQNSGSRNWASVASSADGRKLFAAGNGQIFTSLFGSNPGTAGYLLGGENSAIELQYIGNGQFFPISREGTIQAY
jgi:hypothetical protein